MEAVIVCCYDNYEVRVKYVEKYLIQRGYSVDILTSDFDHIKKQKKAPFDSNCIMFHVPRYKKNVSPQRIFSELVFSKKTQEFIEKKKPRLVYLIAPPNILIKDISKLKRKGTFLLVDLLDVWPETFPNKLIAKNKLWAGLRNNYINHADHVFLECGYFKEFVKGYVENERISIVYLTKETADVDVSFNADTVQILYLGSMNRIFDDISTIELLEHISKYKKVVFHMIGGGEKKEQFISMLKERSIDYVDYGIVFDEKEKERIITKCNYGLNMYVDGVKIGLTMKSIDYFRYGLPVVSKNIVDTEYMIQQYRAGYIVNRNISEIARLIAFQTEVEWNEMRKKSLEVMKENFIPDILYSHLDDVIVEGL